MTCFCGWHGPVETRKQAALLTAAAAPPPKRHRSQEHGSIQGQQAPHTLGSECNPLASFAPPPVNQQQQHLTPSLPARLNVPAAAPAPKRRKLGLDAIL